MVTAEGLVDQRLIGMQGSGGKCAQSAVPYSVADDDSRYSVKGNDVVLGAELCELAHFAFASGVGCRGERVFNRVVHKLSELIGAEQVVY
jgi:hypothetical protein